MSMITGVGDEVVEVVCLLVVAGIAALAWWSTAARPDRFRTVIVMERTARAAPHQLALMSRNIRLHLLRGASTTPTPPTLPDPAGSNSSGEDGLTSRETSEAGSGAEVEPAGSAQAQEMDRIVDAMDADVNVLRHRRLNFFTNSGETMTASTTRLSRSRKINQNDTEKNESEEKPSETQTETSNDENSSNETTESNTEIKNTVTEGTSTEDVKENIHKISIRLKYLNDTLKEVDGSLDELLKDFKWRHFSTELTAQLRVLLIFNGHVLSDDTSTLRVCGLSNNCVVHCLVHPPRQPRQPGGEVVPSLLEAAGVAGVGSGVGAGLEAEGATPQAEGRIWDLENVLMTLVSIILTIIWFFRCEYSNVFTASASGALFALTVFYSVAIFGLYFSDTFHFLERRPANNDQAAQQQAAYT